MIGPLGAYDLTVFASNDVPDDVPVAHDGTSLPGVVLSAFLVLYGASAPFQGLAFDLGRPAEGPGTTSWSYASGATNWNFAPLKVVDGTGSFHASGVVSFAPPADWMSRPTAAQPGCFGDYFFVKSSTDVPFDQVPFATRITQLT